MKRLLIVAVGVLVFAAPVSAAWRAVLGWTDNATNETGFRVERKVGATGAWAAIATLGVDVKSYLDEPLADSTLYCYRIFAFNAAGDSDSDPATAGNQAEEICATTPAGPSVPGAPSGTAIIVVIAP